MKINSRLNAGLWFCFLLIVFAALSRLVPHPYNFTPVGALGLFAGAYLSMRRYWLVPVLALLMSDLLIGFYHPVAMLSVYLAFAATALLGRSVLMGRRSILRIAGTSLSASVIFFVVSNFGDWLSGINGYPLNLAGLMECYVMAVPFFSNTVLGDLFYVTVLFGSYEAVIQWITHQQHAHSV